LATGVATGSGFEVEVEVVAKTAQHATLDHSTDREVLTRVSACHHMILRHAGNPK
jgi:hypothetical protein